MADDLHITHRDAFWRGIHAGRRDAKMGLYYRPGLRDTDDQKAYSLGYEAGWDEGNPCSNGTCNHLAHQYK